MDLLKQEIQKKRKSLAEEAGGKKFFKRSEIEQKKIHKFREEERLEHELKARRRAAASGGTASASASSCKPSTVDLDAAAIAGEKMIENVEVIRRLRFLKQPMTLFGEDDHARLGRLSYVLKEGLFEEVDSDDMTQGQTNDFLRDITELKKRHKSCIIGDKKMKTRDDERGRDEGDMLSGADHICDWDKIFVFYKKLLIEWKQELDAMDNTEKRNATWKKMVAYYKQCDRDLTPLFNICRNKGLPADIREGLMEIVNCCIKRDYQAATHHYVKLAIGNAGWPIGVTMVGIHERSAREKISTNSVAHIMNNETTRKYLQSVKRLMTFCQRRYPTMPSKAFEFNSLANGSDLQSLLAQER